MTIHCSVSVNEAFRIKHEEKKEDYVASVFAHYNALGKKATIHQVTTSKNVLFPGHNHLTTGADDSTLILTYRLSDSEGNN